MVVTGCEIRRTWWMTHFCGWRGMHCSQNYFIRLASKISLIVTRCAWTKACWMCSFVCFSCLNRLRSKLLIAPLWGPRSAPSWLLSSSRVVIVSIRFIVNEALMKYSRSRLAAYRFCVTCVLYFFLLHFMRTVNGYHQCHIHGRWTCHS